jgi:transposase
MAKPFSTDLRERVWRVYKEGDKSQPQVARDFGVSASFVRNLVRRQRETGSLAPKPHGGGHPPALDEAGLEQLAQALADTPDATLEELARALRRKHRLELSVSAVWRALGWLEAHTEKKDSARQRARHPAGAGAAARLPGRTARGRP